MYQPGQRFQGLLAFERRLKVGDKCYALWTNSGYCYEEKVEILKVNLKSYRVKLLKAIEGYPAGVKLNIPCILNVKQWSWNNHLEPIRRG